jgi:hypothetical protein
MRAHEEQLRVATMNSSGISTNSMPTNNYVFSPHIWPFPLLTNGMYRANAGAVIYKWLQCPWVEVPINPATAMETKIPNWVREKQLKENTWINTNQEAPKWVQSASANYDKVWTTLKAEVPDWEEYFWTPQPEITFAMIKGKARTPTQRPKPQDWSTDQLMAALEENPEDKYALQALAQAEMNIKKKKDEEAKKEQFNRMWKKPARQEEEN